MAGKGSLFYYLILDVLNVVTFPENTQGIDRTSPHL